MKTYRITDIIEDEFGCEGRPEGRTDGYDSSGG